jgi:hypothetical protein
MQKMLSAIITALALGVSGCTVKRPMLISSASIGSDQEQVLGVVTGTAHQDYVLSMPTGMTNDYSFKSALDNALHKDLRADTLINVFADRECTYFPFWGVCLFCSCEIEVTGTAIRYTKMVYPDGRIRPN